MNRVSNFSWGDSSRGPYDSLLPVPTVNGNAKSVVIALVLNLQGMAVPYGGLGCPYPERSTDRAPLGAIQAPKRSHSTTSIDFSDECGLNDFSQKKKQS